MRKEYDFTHAKRALEVPHLAKLQAQHAAMSDSNITISLNPLDRVAIKTRSKALGVSYQSLIRDGKIKLAMGKNDELV